VGFEKGDGLSQPLGQGLGIQRQPGGVAVAVSEVDSEEGSSVRCLPQEGGLIHVRADAPPQHRGLETEARQDLRKLPDVAELVRDVPQIHRAAEIPCLAEPEAQVADQGLSRDQPLVGQHVPGTHQ
jgi:hypothetical protein